MEESGKTLPFRENDEALWFHILNTRIQRQKPEYQLNYSEETRTRLETDYMPMIKQKDDELDFEEHNRELVKTKSLFSKHIKDD